MSWALFMRPLHLVLGNRKIKDTGPACKVKFQPYCIALRCIVVRCIALRSITLRCIVLRCAVVRCAVQQNETKQKETNL